MYVDAQLIDGRVYVSSYDKKGERNITTHLPPYVYYHEDDNGSYRSIYGDSLKQRRITDRFKFYNELEKAKARGIAIFESDVPPVFRLLEERFPNDDTPPLKVSFIDIEADKDPSKGWSRVSDPYAIVNAITIYNKWENQYYTIAVAPPTLTRDEAEDLLAQDSNEDGFGSMTMDDGYFVVHGEADLLKAFLDIIADADVLTGWNSTFFDLPYIIQRIRVCLGGERLTKLRKEDGSEGNECNPSAASRPYLERINLFPTQPKMRMVEKYGNVEKTFDICGRVHLDYMELYQKFTFEELHSYTLDAVLQKEVKQTKVQYEGSLDQLYRNDFRTFVAYNRQDVAGLNAMDDKLKMVELANTMVHMAGVTFDKVFGSVSIIEQAILKELHRQNYICFDKKKADSIETSVPGAFVVDPNKGLYEWVCSFDINSLYPSVIRALNISPECVVGQFELPETEERFDKYVAEGMSKTEAWAQFTGVLEYHHIIDEDDDMLTLTIENSGGEITARAKDWKKRIRENGWSLSANGTVFELNREGIVPYCLTKWYEQRVAWKKEASKFGMMQVNETDKDKLNELKMQEEYYDMIQLVMKIFLNSTYGALLNRFCRFYDPRLGKSVTLTGRVITKHMCRYASELMTGNYDFDKRAVIYGDTDSTYCKLDWYMRENDIEPTVENAIAIADELGVKINESFPRFMDENTMVGKRRGKIIEAGREVVGRRGLFKDVKKRYAIHVVNSEGKPTDKMKIMGMEVRRSDTPKIVQDFLTECLEAVVRDGKGYEEVREMVEDFRENVFRALPPWKRGTPGRVSNLTINSRKLRAYEEAKERQVVNIAKPKTHYSVVAANNTNLMMTQHKEHRWDYIHDGDKIEVLYLRPNPHGINSIAIKVGETYAPEWFEELPFDDEKHEAKMVDRKMFNVIGSVLDWSFEPVKDFRDETFEEVDILSL